MNSLWSQFIGTHCTKHYLHFLQLVRRTKLLCLQFSLSIHLCMRCARVFWAYCIINLRTRCNTYQSFIFRNAHKISVKAQFKRKPSVLNRIKLMLVYGFYWCNLISTTNKIELIPNWNHVVSKWCLIFTSHTAMWNAAGFKRHTHTPFDSYRKINWFRCLRVMCSLISQRYLSNQSEYWLLKCAQWTGEIALIVSMPM